MKSLSAYCSLALATLFIVSQTASGVEVQDVNIEHMGLEGRKVIALTFDDGPGAGTASILDTLKAYNVHATFFSVGKMASYHPGLLDRIVGEGHLLANHSYDHDKLGKEIYGTNPELLVEQIRKTHEILAPHMRPGQKLFFRAPYSDWRQDVATIINQDPVVKDYIGPIFWNVGTKIERSENGEIKAAADWACWSKTKGIPVDECLQGYLAKIESEKGGVVLMHDIHRSTAEMFAKMLPILIQRGYKFKMLDQIPQLDLYRLQRPYRVEAGKPVNF